MKHKFIYLLTIILLIFFSALGYSQENITLPSLKGKKVLLVYGGWEGHQPKAFAERITEWLQKEEAIVTLSDSLGVYTVKEIMQNIDIIVQHWTMGKITREQSNALQETVKNGVGLAGCHGGLGDSFRDNTGYQYMIGGQFVAHPGGLIDYSINISDKENPITKGLKNFDIKHTEQYYMHLDPRAKVLATTTFSDTYNYWIKGTVMPVCWTTRFGKGNIFYLSIGHDPNDFDNYEAWQLLTRGIKWTSSKN